MIKFFRHIRQRLVTESKFSKYLLYALGEIFLVVIGILLALQINTWNQERTQHKEEQLALINLKEDFEFNKEHLDSILTRTKESINLKFLILDHTGNKPVPKTEEVFNTSLNAAGSFYPFFPRNGSLDDLFYSGKLGIIKDQNLRNRLSSWMPVFDDIKNGQANVLSEVSKFNEYVIKRGSWLNADAVGQTPTAKNNAFPESGFDIDNRILLEDLEFENTIENLIYQKDKLMESHKKGLKLISEILKLIDQEMYLEP